MNVPIELLKRLEILLETHADHGMQHKYEDGSDTENAVLCRETVAQIRSILAAAPATNSASVSSSLVDAPAQEQAMAQVDPMENWLMKPALEWLEQAEHGGEQQRCKVIAEILRDLWRRQADTHPPALSDEPLDPALVSKLWHETQNIQEFAERIRQALREVGR